jgi:hypothetical protein
MQNQVYGGVKVFNVFNLLTGTLVSGDSFSGSLTRSVGENVANYAIPVGTVSAGVKLYDDIYTFKFIDHCKSNYQLLLMRNQKYIRRCRSCINVSTYYWNFSVRGFILWFIDKKCW